MSILRVTTSAVCFGQVMQNVLHFKDPVGLPPPRTVAASIRDIWLTQMKKHQGSSLRWTSILVQQIDVPGALGFNLPIALDGESGSGTINLHPFACALLKLQTGVGGRHGRGRIYVPFPALDNYEFGNLTVERRAFWEAQFLTQVRAAYIAPASAGFFLGIMPRGGTSSADFKLVETINIRNTAAVQRRRGMGIGI